MGSSHWTQVRFVKLEFQILAMVAKKAPKAKAASKKWELKAFKANEQDPWLSAVLSAQKQLKTKKRNHPALFMLAAVGKHLYEAAQSLYAQANAKPAKKAKAKKVMKV